MTLLTATVKNSKPTELVLQISMECSVITDNVILGSDQPGRYQLWLPILRIERLVMPASRP